MEWSDFTALRAGSARFGAVAGSTYPRTFLTGRGQATENLHVSWVPALGRLIGPEDDDLAATPVAVIGDGYGRRRFGRVREALGATVSFDDVTYVIVGVLPPGFSGPDPSAADVWLPVWIAATASRGDTWRRFRSGFSLMPFVRLAPGVTAEAAGAAATAALRASRIDSPLADRLDTEATALPGPLLPVRHRGRPAVAPARRRRRPGRAPRGRRQRHEPADAAGGRAPPRAGCAQRARGRPVGRWTTAGDRERPARRPLRGSRAGRGRRRRKSAPRRAAPALQLGRRPGGCRGDGVHGGHGAPGGARRRPRAGPPMRRAPGGSTGSTGCAAPGPDRRCATG